MLNWRNPLRELPGEGQLIWVMMKHWKGKIPESYEMFGAKFEKYATPDNEMQDQAQTADYSGSGFYAESFPREPYFHDCNHVWAWIPAEELNIPAWDTKREE